MKTKKKKQIQFFPISFFTFLIIFCSFAPVKPNSQANGGGYADGIQFSFNVISKSGVTSGHIFYGDESYTVCASSWSGNTVLLYTTDGHAFYICDNGKAPSYISDPILAQWEFLSPSDFFGMHTIRGGNIHIRE